MKILRGLDKTTIAAVAMLLIVVLAGWQLLAQQQDVAAKRHQIDALISTVQQHDTEAAADRATAASNQRALLDYTATLAARQDALLGYLRAHGIRLPQRLVTVVPRPRIVVRHHHGHRSGGRTRHRSTSTSTSTSGTTRVPSGPGKSGSAPGHRKHRPH